MSKKKNLLKKQYHDFFEKTKKSDLSDAIGKELQEVKRIGVKTYEDQIAPLSEQAKYVIGLQ